MWGHLLLLSLAMCVVEKSQCPGWPAVPPVAEVSTVGGLDFTSTREQWCILTSFVVLHRKYSSYWWSKSLLPSKCVAHIVQRWQVRWAMSPCILKNSTPYQPPLYSHTPVAKYKQSAGRSKAKILFLPTEICCKCWQLGPLCSNRCWKLGQLKHILQHTPSWWFL